VISTVMRAVIQRVQGARITIEHMQKKTIGKGLLVLVGIEETDHEGDIEWLSGKISRLRIFEDHNGIMNLSVMDVGGEIMIVSQFTLHASTRKGNRPSYIKSAPPEIAVPLYDQFVKQLEKDIHNTVVTGKFGAYMEINLINDGPVTIIIDSKNRE